MKIIKLYLFIFLLPVLASGQEVISGLISNAEVAKKAASLKDRQNYKSGIIELTPLQLPFFDDFSELGVYPDTARWMENEAYINSSFPYYPVNYGVATLDAIDADGNLYPEASPFPFIADHLTSRPIRLDSVFNPATGAMQALTPADSIALSFYYQPQGRGDIPLGVDSLVLEFGRSDSILIFSYFDSTQVWGSDYFSDPGTFLLPGDTIFPPLSCDLIPHILSDTLYFNQSLMIPCDSIFKYGVNWTWVWSAPGDTLETFIANKEAFFDYVKIPITDTNWFHNDFQFRFSNYASLSPINSWQSNTDQWHLDVVSLDYHRTQGDRFVHEIRFVEDAPSLIVDYSTMPYIHYSGNFAELKKDSIPVFVHNNDSLEHSVSYSYSVKDADGNAVPTGVGPMIKNLPPFTATSIFDYTKFMDAPIKFYYNVDAFDSTDFYITHVVTDVDSTDITDTLRYHQKFRNYFAYDDGSAEAGYGLSPGGAKLAVKFKTEFADTLRGVQLYFNKTKDNSNYRNFDLVVWADNNGKPGERIYTQEGIKPQFTNGLNRFYNFLFTNYLVPPIGVFYVGWDQSSNVNLNIGYDRNTNSQKKNFYNTDGSWTKSSFKGSIMIRPIVGKALSEQEPYVKASDNHIEVYPNPSTRESHVQINVPYELTPALLAGNLRFMIYDLYGKKILEGTYTNSLPVAQLHTGYYLLCLYDVDAGTYYTTKMLIAQ